jgi:hypothetical protein
MNMKTTPSLLSSYSLQLQWQQVFGATTGTVGHLYKGGIPGYPYFGGYPNYGGFPYITGYGHPYGHSCDYGYGYPYNGDHHHHHHHAY